MKETLKNPLWYSIMKTEQSYKDVLSYFISNPKYAFNLFVHCICFNHDPYINNTHILMVLTNSEFKFKEQLAKYFYAWVVLSKDPFCNLYLENPFNFNLESAHCTKANVVTPEFINELTKIVCPTYKHLEQCLPNIDTDIFKFLTNRFDLEIFCVENPTMNNMKLLEKATKLFVAAAVYETRQTNFTNANLTPREVSNTNDRDEIIQERHRLKTKYEFDLKELPPFFITLNSINPRLIHRYEPFPDDHKRALKTFITSLVYMYKIDFALYFLDILKRTVKCKEILEHIATVTDLCPSIDLRRITTFLNKKRSLKQKAYILGLKKCSMSCINSMYEEILSGIKMEDIISRNISKYTEKREINNTELFSTGDDYRLYPSNEIIWIKTTGDTYHLFSVEEICTLVRSQEKLNPYNREPLSDELIEKYQNEYHRSFTLEQTWSQVLFRDFRIDLE